ncbi:MAG: hypothetical protein K8R90_07355 [Candidatus Cloacimonetes bacterium]|nr:hypothetical protein [Candidatus Cloacimonadota bacterium]
MEKQKKLRAAVGAVMAYLHDEKTARAATPPRPNDTPWSLYGRQTIMRNRAQCQTFCKKFGSKTSGGC